MLVLAVVGLGCRVVVGGVFIVAGIGKVRGPDGASRLLQAVLALSTRTAYRAVSVIAGVEFVVGASLFFGLALPVVLNVALLILLVFTAVIFIGHTVAGVDECGCFGGRNASWMRAIARNAALVVLIAVALAVAPSVASIPMLAASTDNLPVPWTFGLEVGGSVTFAAACLVIWRLGIRVVTARRAIGETDLASEDLPWEESG
jgi:uncharacterized membrane protein YphA (DoxX/SURF4 family)